MELIVLISACALIVIAGIAILNALTFPRLRPNPTPSAEPLISVLIPARNEAAVIATTVRALLAQDYPALEIILLDDHSTDGTGALALGAAAGDARLRVIDGRDLPPGWLGKNWACQQLGEAARGDLLVFSDADVTWNAGALRALAACGAQTRAHLLTVWPTQITRTWAERLVVPLMALVIHGYLPALAVSHTRFASLAAACGQCLAFRRAAYVAVGGHAAVRGSIIEDIALARRIKRCGLRLIQADGAGLIACRMYTGWPGVRDGYAKNIIAGYGGVAGLLLATVFHWALFVLPVVYLFSEAWRGWGVGLLALGVGLRALTAAVTRQRASDALLMPLSALLMTRIALQALYWRVRYGGPRWKGRTIPA